MNQAAGAPVTAGYRRYVLGLLMVVGLFNYIDRWCMSILSVPIKKELALSDTQVGMLTGIAFSLVYTLLAVPIARAADRGSRKLVIIASLAVWSLMTAACGFVASFSALMVLRMGVAIGESGCAPSTHALLSDYFAVHERGRAIALWQLTFPLGTLIGMALSGWLIETVGWRHTFMMLGSFGLCLAPVLLLTLREPVRGAADAVAHPAAERSLLDSFRELGSLRAYRNLLLGAALTSYPLNAALAWNAIFYNSVFGLSVKELGVILALLSGGAGAIGLYAGGALADRLGRRDPRWHLRVPGIAGLAVAPLMLAQYFAADAYASLAFGVLPVMLLNVFLPPMAATAQSLVRPNLRALAAATIVLVAGTLGTALGPFLTGVISDQLAPAHGTDSLRYAIGFSSLLAALGGVFFLRAAHHLPAELPRSIPA